MSAEAKPKQAIRELHQSEINAFLKCGKLWEFRYVQGIKVAPRGALTVGRAVDAAITHNLAQKITTGADLPVGDVLDVASSEFDREAPDTEWGEDKPGEEKDTAISCVKAHHAEIAPRLQPASVQEKFVLETNAGYNLGGTIDITTKDDWVRDSKTAARKGMYSAAGSVQAAMYDFAFEALRGRRARGFAFDIMVKPTKTLPSRTEVVESVVTQGDREWVFDTIHNVDKAMRAGVALPAPETAWWCSAKWCGYWSMCKGKK